MIRTGPTAEVDGAEAPAPRRPRIAWGEEVPLAVPERRPSDGVPGRPRGAKTPWPTARAPIREAGPVGAALQVRAYLAVAARTAIEVDVRADLTRERGGLLVGTVERLGADRYVVDVRAAIPAVGAEGGGAWWRLTPQAWDHVSRELEVRHPGQIVVGWYHSHPGIGCFFSGVDRNTQRHLFPNPWNLGAVVDPVAHRPGAFGTGRRAVPIGTTPFRWFVGPDSLSAPAPDVYQPPATVTVVRTSTRAWRLPRRRKG